MQRLWASSRHVALIGCSIALAATLAPQAASSHPGGGHSADAEDAALTFDPANYTSFTVTVDGQATNVRWYKEICDVAAPVAAAAQQTGIGGTTTISNTRCGYQSINVFVAESTAGDQRAPIYFAVNNAGWMASYIKASVTAGASYASSKLGSWTERRELARHDQA
ncbi:hypothetical protein ACQPZX_32645 [Actinoplanes sp. CA-142083]|uniref:hypothetical protein n=1 Tax=Actinoplanes sp. CA-142083 TaxID=3239903 RepID=UPI003D9109C0